MKCRRCGKRIRAFSVIGIFKIYRCAKCGAFYARTPFISEVPRHVQV